MPLSDKIKSLPSQHRKTPLWRGPTEDGVTFTLLSRFLSCRERFRLLVMEGLKAREGWNHRTGYGDMWHKCEQALAAVPAASKAGHTTWLPALIDFSRQLCSKHPTQQELIDHWYNVCKVEFPVYVRYWREHPDVKDRTPIEQEQPFSVEYTLPSGRKVILRGKRDSVDIIGKDIWFQENKTKGDIYPPRMQRQLTFDLQTMIYMVALHHEKATVWDCDGHDAPQKNRKIRGVRYNVVRRPLSGGKGSITRHKAKKNKPAETKTEFYSRLAGIIEEDPGHYFMRWQVEITPKDIDTFRRQCLNPVLEQLCDWWEFVTTGDPWRPAPPVDQEDEDMRLGLPYAIHWRHPFGVYNPLDEGLATDLDEYLVSGSTVGLERVDNLYPELT